MLNKPKEEENSPDQFTEPQEFSTYTGTYYNNVYGKVNVEIDDTELIMHMGLLGDPFHLIHINRDSFEVMYNHSGIKSIGVATFKIGISGEAKSFSIDSFIDEGTGDFKRIEENE